MISGINMVVYGSLKFLSERRRVESRLKKLELIVKAVSTEYEIELFNNYRRKLKLAWDKTIW